MADYKAIHGKNILHVASDLDSAEGEGQIWFNTTSSDYKTIVKATAAWASGGAMNTARRNVGSAGATQSSAMVAAGTPPQTGITETYDGTSWTEVGDLNQVRVSPEGDGPITAALMIGGYTDPPTVFRDETELYNGTSWTELNDLNTGRDGGSAMGTSTAMEFVGGAAGGNQDISETFDGTSWTEGSDLNTGRHSAGPAGTATAGAIFGGLPASNPPISLHEQHDGSSWTEVADLNTGRYTGAGCGTQTAALYACGNTGSITGVSEIWDGTAWAATATASEARQGLGGAGTTSAAVVFAGINPPLSPAFRATTEEFDFSSTLAAGAWASGGTFPVSVKERAAGAGTQTAALSVGGSNPGGSYTDDCIEYDGSSWTANPNAFPATNYGLWGTGTATAALIFGGRLSPGSYSAEAYTFNGTSFSAVNDMQSARYYLAGAGTATASVAFGGHDGSDRGYSEEFDGTNWAEGDDLNTARDQLAGTGTQTAGLAMGGSPASVKVEEYNGTSWSEVTGTPVATQTQSAWGIQTAALMAGGETTATIGECYTYDGSAWTAVADLSNTRYGHASLGGSAPQNLGAVWAGASGGTDTEEWTVAQNIKTITD